MQLVRRVIILLIFLLPWCCWCFQKTSQMHTLGSFFLHLFHMICTNTFSATRIYLLKSSIECNLQCSISDGTILLIIFLNPTDLLVFYAKPLWKFHLTFHKNHPSRWFFLQFMEMSNYALFQTRSGLFVNRTARVLLFEVSIYWGIFLHNLYCGQNDINFRDQAILFLMLGPCLQRRAESPWTSKWNDIRAWGQLHTCHVPMSYLY